MLLNLTGMARFVPTLPPADASRLDRLLYIRALNLRVAPFFVLPLVFGAIAGGVVLFLILGCGAVAVLAFIRLEVDVHRERTDLRAGP